MEELRNAGLDTVAVSLTSLHDGINNEIMNCPHDDFDVLRTVQKLSKFFTVRITYMLSKLSGPEVKTPDWFVDEIMVAKYWGAKQITFRTIGKPSDTDNKEVREWVDKFADPHSYAWCFEQIGTKLWDFDWNGRVYDVNGMSVCISDCLDDSPKIKLPRSFVFDGNNLRYSWDYEGAIIF
jgi:hypothetical protein